MAAEGKGVLAGARFDHVGLPAARLDPAIAFYGTLGARVSQRRPSRLAGGQELAFLSSPGSPPALELLAPVPGTAPGWAGGCHVAFSVSDLAGALAECAAASLDARPACDAAGRLVAVHLTDPSGTRIELIAPERAA
jgi:catechol 2,3-dioxygenase-like lactoylglutathione lyase family enzyme